MQSVTLYNGTEIPLIGYGTLQITGPAQYKRCMDDAIARPLSAGGHVKGHTRIWRDPPGPGPLSEAQ